MKKNTVHVDLDGNAHAQDDHLREWAEGNVYLVPESGEWMPRPIKGTTVRSPLPAHLTTAPVRKYSTARAMRA